MPLSMNNTTLTFNDASTQTTAGVTSIVAGTGISSSGGLTPTIANTGVTSIVAGTGISISGGTGAVTITNSQPGAVSSVNGQTGAITTTNIDSIGTTIACVHTVTAGVPSAVSINQNSTVAGASLRYSYTAATGEGRMNQQSGNSGSTGYNQGGTAPAGTWRCVGRSAGYGTFNDGCGNRFYYWTPGLFVRIS
jgi:hypothetical protein